MSDPVMSPLSEPSSSTPGVSLPLGTMLAVILPGMAVLIGLAFWLWGRHGESVWFDAASAFIAGCFG